MMLHNHTSTSLLHHAALRLSLSLSPSLNRTWLTLLTLLTLVMLTAASSFAQAQATVAEKNVSASPPAELRIDAAKEPWQLRWMHDLTGKLNVDQVFSTLARDQVSRWNDFVEGEDHPTGGGSAVWLHVRLAQNAKDEVLYLHFQRGRILRVDMYADIQGETGWKKSSAGLLVAFADRPLPTLHPTFALQTSKFFARDYLLRVQHLAPLKLKPRLWTSVPFADHMHFDGVLVGLSVGALLLFLAACAVAFVATKNRGFPGLATFAAVIAFGLAPVLGLSGRWLWPQRGDLDWTVLWIMPIFTAAANVLLLLLFLHQVQLKRWYRYGLWIAAGILVTLCVTHFVNPRLMPLAFTRTVALLVSLLLVITVISVSGKKTAWLRPVLWGSILIFVFDVARAMRVYGWIANNDLLEAGSSFIRLVQLVLIFVALLQKRESTMTRAAMEKALADSDPVTGLSTERVVHEAVTRSVERELSAVLILAPSNLETLKTQLTPAQLTAMMHELGARLRPLSGVTSVIAHAGDGCFLWVLDHRVTDEALINYGREIRLCGIRPFAALAPEHTLVMHSVAMRRKRSDLSSTETIEILRAELQSVPAGEQRAIRIITV
jgi:GGDEF domain-containing protein